MTDPILRAEGIDVRRRGVPILRGIDLNVTSGRILACLGPSGAGKTTLFRTIVGEERPHAGRISFDGHDVSRAPLWKRARLGIAYLPQTPSVLFDLDVRQNLETYATLVSRPVQEIFGLAERLELSSLMKVRAGDLSGGERRRLELARALSRRPRVLVCDEPWSGVDPAFAGRIAALLRELSHDQGVGVLLADHHVTEALGVADDVVLLLDGAIELRGTPAEFVAHPVVQGRYLGHWRSGESLPPG